jgi:hypothetical protein
MTAIACGQNTGPGASLLTGTGAGTTCQLQTKLQSIVD